MRPVLWSFRRCPYAMRARLALASAGIQVELREIVLRDKPKAFLAASPSATVPCLENAEGVIDESLDIMLWALRQNDPEGWLNEPRCDLIDHCDGPFKDQLDRYKYPTRYQDADAPAARTQAAAFLKELNDQLGRNAWLFGDSPRLTDMALLPFIRQFAHVDIDWFEAQPWSDLIRWLNAFKSAPRFAAIMTKYPAWRPGDEARLFP